MTELEELSIDAHILASSNLRITSRGYKALELLLNTGNVLCKRFGDDYDVFVSFTKVLDHLHLPYKFISEGLELKENAKINYYENIINRMPVEFKKNKYFDNRSNKLGKDEPEDNNIGWANRRIGKSS